MPRIESRLKPHRAFWVILDRKIGDLSLRTKVEFKEAVTVELAKITPEETKNLVESMQRRLEAVTKAKGGPTKY